MKHLFLAAIGIALSCHAHAQLDTFDINLSTSGVISSYPSSLINYNNDLYFSAKDQPNGFELRRFESGKSHPTLVHDLVPGPINSMNISSKSIGVMDNVIYFTAADTLYNYELWSYDGTNVKLAAEINASPTSGSGPFLYTPFDEKLFFAAADQTHGQELWCYDPIAKKATLVQDINPGTDNSNIFTMQEYKGKLYIACSSGPSTNLELHVYDPVEKKVSMVQDLHVGPLGALSRHMTVAGGKLYFIATDGSTGTDIYSYDGTGPIKRVTDLYPGKGNGVTVYDFHEMLIEYNGSLYFDGYNPAIGFYQLCEYNLTTEKITYHPLTSSNIGNSTSDYAIYNNKLFFAASDGVHGLELWSYDGTNKPTMAADISVGVGDSKPKDLTVAHGYLYFNADMHPIGEELFRYKESTSTIENVNSNIHDIAVYPNPTTDNVHIEFSLDRTENLNISLTDIQGRIVFSTGNKQYGKPVHRVAIPTESIAGGTYMYYITSNDGVIMHSGKLVKQ